VAAFWENFEYSIEQAMNYTSNIIINGDLNVDLLRENNNKLLEIISEFNITNVIKEKNFKIWNNNFIPNYLS
jgi:hypothetical protein